MKGRKAKMPVISNYADTTKENEKDISNLFDGLAGEWEYWRNKNHYYHNEILRFYKAIVPEGKNILEIGSADGYLLNELTPVHGIGLDISAKMTESARTKYPHLTFINKAIEDYDVNDKFDYVIMSNLLEHVFDLYYFFNILRKKIFLKTKIIIMGINPIWEPIMKVATKLKIRTPVPIKNFVTYKDMENILSVTGYEIIESGYRIFLPINIPLVSYFLNKLIPRLPIIKNLCLIQYTVARPRQNLGIDNSITCSVIIPCHNEEGNIRECIDRVPCLGKHTEIVIVDDGSTDRTVDVVKEIQKSKGNVRLISYSLNKGKGSAVKVGFESAHGDILIILDADMAVSPEELTKFYNVLASHQAEFVNGTRMVYDMAPGAMKFLNYVGNKIFGIILSFIVSQRNTDTLCGVKALYKADYINFKMGKCPWGDFDLLFETGRMKLKTVEIPVHYYPRLKGISKMKAFRHGVQLMKMCWYGFWYLG